MQTSGTAIDYTDGVAHTHLPQTGILNPLETAFAGAITERELSTTLPPMGVYSAQNVVTRHLGGASSYDQALTGPTKAGENIFHVPTTRGLFVGQKLVVTTQRGAYGNFEEVTVQSFGEQLVSDPTLGHMLQAQVVTASPATLDHPTGAIIYNKNMVNGITVDDVSHCDNQASGFAYNKTVYGLGDSFILAGSLTYQSDIMSGAGDEGAVGIAIVFDHDLNTFWGTVERWNPQTRELVYAAGGSNPQTLGTSRPLINMSKLITSPAAPTSTDRIMVTRPNEDPFQLGIVIPNYAQITARKKDVSWDSTVVGWFIAIDEPTEYYDQGEALANGSAATERVHRWWRITGLTDRRGYDGETYYVLAVESHLWWATTRMGPTLIRGTNYTDSASDRKLLRYILAPGAWISDVRRGIAGLQPGNMGTATAQERRTLVLAPSPTSGTPHDFAPGDRITNPPGPDVWLPTAFRARHWDNYPGHLAGTSFLTESNSKVQLRAGLQVDAPNARTLDQVAQHQKDGAPSFRAGISIMASTDFAIEIWGDVPGSLSGGYPGAALTLLREHPFHVGMRRPHPPSIVGSCPS